MTPSHPPPNPLCFTPQVHHNSRSKIRLETPGGQGTQLLLHTDINYHSHRLTLPPVMVRPQNQNLLRARQ